MLRAFLFGLQHWVFPHSQPVAKLVLGEIQLSIVLPGALELWPIIRFQLDQFLQMCSIFVELIGCIFHPCNRGVTVFFFN